jgi:hypothetical protein
MGTDEKQKKTGDLLWWGEAPDEPAREDARPTKEMDCSIVKRLAPF